MVDSAAGNYDSGRAILDDSHGRPGYQLLGQFIQMNEIRLGDLKDAAFNPAQIIKARGLPKGWQIKGETDRIINWHDQHGLIVTMGSQKQEDGKIWIQIVVKRRSRMPTLDDLIKVRKLFVDADDIAYMIFPPIAEGLPQQTSLWICPGEKPLWAK